MNTFTIPDDFVDKLKQTFNNAGFSDNEFSHHVNELGKVILMKSLTKLLEQKPPVEKFTSEDMATEYVKSNFTSDEIQKVIEEQGKILISEYLSKVNVKI
jgi:hypothetical protein